MPLRDTSRASIDALVRVTRCRGPGPLEPPGPQDTREIHGRYIGQIYERYISHRVTPGKRDSDGDTLRYTEVHGRRARRRPGTAVRPRHRQQPMEISGGVAAQGRCSGHRQHWRSASPAALCRHRIAASRAPPGGAPGASQRLQERRLDRSQAGLSRAGRHSQRSRRHRSRIPCTVGSAAPPPQTRPPGPPPPGPPPPGPPPPGPPPPRHTYSKR
jgi:hypothetical protein